jgi:hypothetical protein
MAGKPPRNSSSGKKTSPETIAAKIKAAKALELRMAGKTYPAIAEEAGYNSPQAAHDAVKRSLDAVIREPAEALIRLDLERLDSMLEIHLLSAQGGDVQAVSAVMKIMERRARLLGLDAPTKVAETDPEGNEKAAQPTVIKIVPVRPAPPKPDSASGSSRG